ncbi:MAG TPA: SWIM zinc finger family protein [Gemmatimonadaceae bacterium]|nr:SWIM zinc finger family protein [Gemmatimonadaceae bacterium]
MTAALTSDQVLALAPDAASAKAGAALATPRKWVSVGSDGERVVWGECQGSGAQPYRTQVDLAEPAFRCSCPSRKFPCKHALGLLLLHAASPALFTAGEPPAWVAEWLAERQQRMERRASRAEASEKAAPDPAAQARRAEARAAKIEAGLDELALWLRDLIRAGLAAAPSRPASFWEGMAARLVDAQAPGAARLVRQLGEIATSGDGWAERLLARVGRLHVLVEAHRRFHALPAPMQADVRRLLGWTLSEAELASEPDVTDRWVVIGQALDEDGPLRVRRTWLAGRATGRTALLLHFAHGTAPFAEVVPPVGGALDAALVFHPGSVPQRAIARAPGGTPETRERAPLPPARQHLRDATAAYAAALAADPWVERVPLVLDVVPERAGDGWRVRDAAGDALPVSRRFRAGWVLLALSGGHPLWLSAEWDGESLLPLAASADGATTPVPLAAPSAA